MPHYAYIDESGTLSEHQVMTVSLVLFDGRRTADRAHHKILKELYPHLANDLKALATKKLHFTDMPTHIQNQVATHLASERISAVINSHWHTMDEETHGTSFGRYTKMVQLLLYKALEMTTGEMNVIIAQQGGWETYEKSFLSEVDKATELFSKRNKQFRSVNYELKPAHSVCGLQLADFYAGTVRKMYLDSLAGLEVHLSSPYDLVQHQISLEDFIDLE
jgi:Protein of unknown function (DUF3800)